MFEIYRIFCRDWEHVLDLSDDALLELYNHESYGTPICQNNGFAHGKKWLNLHVNMWKEDIRDGILWKHELYDGTFPEWWLDNVLRDI